MCVSAAPKSQGTEVYTFNNYPNKLTLFDICETKLIGINELHIWRKLGRIFSVQINHKKSSPPPDVQ